MVPSPANPGTSFHIEEHDRWREACSAQQPRQGQSRHPIGEQTMAKDAIVSDEFAKKFASEKETPYTRWVKSEGLDLISSTYVPSLHTVALKPWARRGGRGVFLNHEASRTSNDCYVCEIPPGKTLSPQRQLFEETIMILSGRGSTTVWNDAGQRITFEWKAGALFAIPLNCRHQHFNGSGRDRHQPLRGLGFHLRHQPQLQGPLQRRAGLLLRQGRNQGLPAGDELRAR